jgi:hypothetical protein
MREVALSYTTLLGNVYQFFIANVTKAIAPTLSGRALNGHFWALYSIPNYHMTRNMWWLWDDEEIHFVLPIIVFLVIFEVLMNILFIVKVNNLFLNTSRKHGNKEAPKVLKFQLVNPKKKCGRLVTAYGNRNGKTIALLFYHVFY